MMPPNGKKHDCQSVPLDILSSLPECVLQSILMCLPLRDAVRTSVLSKNWRYNWCRLPQLILDETIWKTTQDDISPTRETTQDDIYPTIRFTDIIYHFITLHVGPITKFTLSLDTPVDYYRINNLICFLSRNDIQQLVLEFGEQMTYYKLPPSFFSCLQLRHLRLLQCLLFPPPTFKGFDRLISLKLTLVVILPEYLASLISHCPLLEQLVLRHNVCEVIDINAPMLRSFDFAGGARTIRLKSVPRLAKLSLRHGKYHMGTGICDIAKFFESTSALEHLELNDYSLKFLAAEGGELPKQLPYDLNSVKYLCISGIYLGELVSVSCALCLIRSLPCLQYLEFQVGDENDDIPALESLEMEALSDITFNHLREVKLENTRRSKPEMQLIKLLLAKSPVLVRMLIEPFDQEDEFAGVPEVMYSFHRASPQVKVVFNYYASS